MGSSNIYYNTKYQWGAYIALFIALAFVPTLIGDDVFLLNQLSVFGVYAILALSELVLGIWRHFEPRAV